MPTLLERFASDAVLLGEPADLGGIGSTREAEEWLAEANALPRLTPRDEKVARSFARAHAGHVPRGGAGSFASYDALISAITSGQVYPWDYYKIAPSASQGAAGLWQTLWTATGSPGAGAAPAATPGTVRDSAAGSVNFPAPGGGQNKFITTFGGVANQNCVIAVYDRLVDVASIAMGSTGSKTVSSSALDRYSSNTTALNNQAWVEMTVASTVTAPVCHLLSYTSGDGTAAQVGTNLTFPAAATVLTWAGQLPFAAAKAGIQACSTINCDTAGTSSPTVNFVIARPLAYLPILANVWNERDLVLQLTALPQVFDNASLYLQILAASGVTTTVLGNLRLAYG